MSTMDNTQHGNYWTSLDNWPTATMTPWYLQGDGSLSPTLPTAATTAATTASSSSYSYDPTDPTPSNGGNNLLMNCGPLDQSAIEQRDDIVVSAYTPQWYFLDGTIQRIPLEILLALYFS
jgi:hypothetical protein